VAAQAVSATAEKVAAAARAKKVKGLCISAILAD
jgi:hypothetical protein